MMSQQQSKTLSECGGRRRRHRRGNTMVLVVAILVLLAIVATSYLTRTHAGRFVAISLQRSSLRDDSSRAIAEALAAEIAGALFPARVDDRNLLGDPEVWQFGRVADANYPRRQTFANALRYDFDSNAAYNFAPYHVVPFTNWPDPPCPYPILAMLDLTMWPAGPGNPNGGTISPALDSEGNPFGNPGFGDTRWLADLEPIRVFSLGQDGLPDTGDEFWHFVQWRHMTNIARANNAWRMCIDIANVYTDADGDGVYETPNVVTDLNIPLEQWLALLPVNQFLGLFFAPQGDNEILDAFGDQWNAWFGFNLLAPGAKGYERAYLNNDPVDNTFPDFPANFYNLRDLNADGFVHLWMINGVHQERPESEFIAGTARHTVSRVLADTDGDGFTDAYWFLAPTAAEDGIRRIVAVRIVDNGGMLNASVATRFDPNDVGQATPAVPSKTKGSTPADLALTGALIDPSTDVTGVAKLYNVGYYDNLAHWFNSWYGTFNVSYDDGFAGGTDPASLWRSHLDAVNLSQYVSLIPGDADFLQPIEIVRLDYWRRAGLLSLVPDPTSPYTPFGIPEEIELRMFHGNNYPWIYSRLELTTQPSHVSLIGFLHGGANLELGGSSEFLGRLPNPDLLLEPRHRLTTYNGARNDLMPPWVRWASPGTLRWEVPQDIVLLGAQAEVNFLNQSLLKLDLREANGGPLLLGERYLKDRLASTLTLALTDGPADIGTDMYESYYGSFSGGNDMNLRDTRRLATALAANSLAYRDDDTDLEVFDDLTTPGLNEGAISLPEVGGHSGLSGQLLRDDTVRFAGLERQPFLVEAFIGHVHEGQQAQLHHFGLLDDPEIDAGDYILCSTSPQSTIVAVEIANPFGQDLSLEQFRLSVFGQDVDFNPVDFIPAGESRTFYSMEDAVGSPIDAAGWKSLLGIDDSDTEITSWSRNRSFYDTGGVAGDSEHAVELFRAVFDPNSDSNVYVLLDRIDNRALLAPDDFEFGSTITGMNYPADQASCMEPELDDPWFGARNIHSNTHWAQWVRVSRVWEREFNTVPGIQPDEESPRYVFAHRFGDKQWSTESISPKAYNENDPSDQWFGQSDVARFGSKDKGTIPNSSVLTFSMQMLQKDGDFEQVGELLNVWLFGHELEFDASGGYVDTTKTFSESMWDELWDEASNTPVDFDDPDDPVGVNRLRLRPVSMSNGASTLNPVIGIGDVTRMDDPRHSDPALPAGMRALDAFVCDGPGVNTSTSVGEYRLAHEFSGKATPGQINVNTASPEVMRASPHAYRLIHESGLDELGAPVPDPAPRVRLPEAIERYRDRSVAASTGTVPNYSNRGGLIGDGLRPERGIASIGELRFLTVEPGTAPPLDPDPNAYKRSWRVDLAARNPFDFPVGFGSSLLESSRISTDVVEGFDSTTNGLGPDEVAQDIEEENLLFSGLSNLVTTRSDVFTVYFRIRSFRQDPVSGQWDATNKENIIEDSRYVMLVDRSEVNRPADKPRIIYLEKLPK